MKTFRELALLEMSQTDIEKMMAKYGVDSSKQDFSKIVDKEPERDVYSTNSKSYINIPSKKGGMKNKHDTSFDKEKHKQQEIATKIEKMMVKLYKNPKDRLINDDKIRTFEEIKDIFESTISTIEKKINKITKVLTDIYKKDRKPNKTGKNYRDRPDLIEIELEENKRTLILIKEQFKKISKLYR